MLQLLILTYNQGFACTHAIWKSITMLFYVLGVSSGILLMHLNTQLAAFYLFTAIDSVVLYCSIFFKAFAIPITIKKFKSRMVKRITSQNKNCHGNKVALATVRSVNPLGIKVGPFHVCERMGVPSLIGFGARNIIRLLIAFRNR